MARPMKAMKAMNRGVKCLTLFGVGLLVVAAHGYWFGESGHFAAKALAEQVAEQERRANALGERNRALAVEVLALKDGLDVIERRARADLGMVAEGETFYMVLEKP